MGWLSKAAESVKQAVSNAVEPIRNTTSAMADTPAVLANVQNGLIQAAGVGAGKILSDPNAIAGIASGVMTGGVSTGLSGLLGGFGVPDVLTSLLSGGNRSPTAAPVVVNGGAGPASNTGGYGEPKAATPTWVWIAAGGAVLVLILGGFLMMGRGRR